MTTPKTHGALLATALLSAAAFLPAAAWSQQGGKGLSPDAMAAYGGRWSTACADASAPTLQVREDQLIVERGKRRVVGQSPETAHSFFGNSQPPARFDVLHDYADMLDTLDLHGCPRWGGDAFIV